MKQNNLVRGEEPLCCINWKAEYTVVIFSLNPVEREERGKCDFYPIKPTKVS